MKTVFNIVLVLCAAALIYICYTSIMGPINFENAKKDREKAVIARLIDIRKAQQEYRTLHRGMYTDKFDTLIDFVKNQKLPFVMKMGMLTDKQLEDGLTEKKAMAIIEKAKKTGKYDEVKKWGLENFKRDTMWVAVMDTIFPKGFNPDSMRYIPYGGGAQFEMNVRNDTAKSGAPVYLFEVKAPYETYLDGLDKQEIINLKDVQSKLGRKILTGMKIKKRREMIMEQQMFCYQCEQTAGCSQVGLPGLVACEAAYRHGDEWLEGVLAYIKANAEFTRAYLQEHLSRVKMTKLEGTYLVWLDFRDYGLTDKELDEKILNQAGLWLDSGAVFGKCGEGFQRINIACPRKTLQQALDRLIDVFA